MSYGVQLCGDGIRVQICEPECFRYGIQICEQETEAPCDCPEGLAESYDIDNGMLSPIDSEPIYRRYEEYSNPDCTGTLLYWAEERLGWYAGGDFPPPLTLEKYADCDWRHPDGLDYYTEFRDNGSFPDWENEYEVAILPRLELASCAWGVNFTAIMPDGFSLKKTTGPSPVGTYSQNWCDDGTLGVYQHGSAQSARFIGAAVVTDTAP